MRAVDTDIVVRLAIRDEPLQLRAAEAFVAAGAWVSMLVLVEALWVLKFVYGLGRKEHQLAAVEILLQHDRLVLQDADVVREALTVFRSERQ